MYNQKNLASCSQRSLMYPESNFLGSTSGVFILKYLSSSLFESKKRSVSSKLYVEISKVKIGWTQ